MDLKNQDGSWITGASLFTWKFVHGYSIAIFLGVLFSCLTIMYFWKRYKYSWEVLQILMIITIPTAVIGARFYTLLVDGGWDSWYLFSGLSIYGALVFSIPVGMIYMWTKRHLVDFRTAMSIIFPSILIGQLIGRWGNFLNHEVYGHIVSKDSLAWTTFIQSHMFIDGHYRAPIFLYESLASSAGYLFIIWYINRKSILQPGASAGLYMVWYGIERLILQLFRDPSQASWIDAEKTISLNFIVSIIFIIIGLALMVWFQLLTKPFSKKLAAISKPLAKFIDAKFKKEYEVINPVKPRRIFFFGKKVETKKKYFYFFGPDVPNLVKLYIPIKKQKKLSKRAINKSLPK